jgi:hypothetical protein
MSEFSMQDVARAMARSLALRVFAGDPDQETKVNDAESTAWEFSQTAPENATTGTVAWYAVRAVRDRRHFQESVRSVDRPETPGRQRASRARFRKVHVDLGGFASMGDDPAVIVAFRMDTEAFFNSLKDRDRQVALTLASGTRTEDAAVMFQVTDGRIAQLRKELKRKWDALQS